MFQFKQQTLLNMFLFVGGFDAFITLLLGLGGNHGHFIWQNTEQVITTSYGILYVIVWFIVLLYNLFQTNRISKALILALPLLFICQLSTFLYMLMTFGFYGGFLILQLLMMFVTLHLFLSLIRSSPKNI